MGQLDSFNPATGELVGSVETLKPGEVQAVVDDVAEVQPFWAQLSLADRARYLRKAADVLVEEIDEVAQLLTREQGKPILESYTMEVVPSIDVLRWCAGAGPKILADEPIGMSQARVHVEAGEVQLRADGRRRSDRAVELPLVDPLRRGRDGPDGRQRRRPQAGEPDTRFSGSGFARRSRRPGSRRVLSGWSTAAAPSAGRCASPRRERSSSPDRWRSVARSARSAPDSSRGRCWSWAARTRRSFAPTPTLATRSRAAFGAASRTPGRPARGSSAPMWSRRLRTASSRGW